MSVKFRISSFAAAAMLVLASTSAAALDDSDAKFSTENDTTPSSGAIAMDVLVLRPLSLAGTLLGGVVFLAGLPFEAASGNVPGAAHRLVGEPAAYTFTRPIGQTGGRSN
jgi:hypothetical protein